ncbi:hypothetical protein EAE96_000326 [Botrytis aclada]|nr:hypothetical protein EAE96_000326 [Botrytis aclada]
MQHTPFSEPCITSRTSEPSKPAENTINSTGELSPPHLEKESHPLRKSKSRSSNLSPKPIPHKPNSTAPDLPEPSFESASQTPSEHSSGSDAAFYCSVGSPSSDEEDGSSALVLGAEGEVEGKSSLTKSALREAVSTSGTDGGGMGEEIRGADDEDEEEGEEENKIHNNNSKSGKSKKKRFTFLGRLFGRKKARNKDRGAGGIS